MLVGKDTKRNSLKEKKNTLQRANPYEPIKVKEHTGNLQKDERPSIDSLKEKARKSGIIRDGMSD
jgi:hypothetical protein